MLGVVVDKPDLVGRFGKQAGHLPVDGFVWFVGGESVAEEPVLKRRECLRMKTNQRLLLERPVVGEDASGDRGLAFGEEVEHLLIRTEGTAPCRVKRFVAAVVPGDVPDRSTYPRRVDVAAGVTVGAETGLP